MRAHKHPSTFAIAATYIGTVVGAGFASGQEILQFFTYFGFLSIPAILLAGYFFFFFGLIILRLGHRLHARSHLDVIHHAAGPVLGTVIDGIITFFLFGALTAMAAGAGAVLGQQFGLPPLLGSALITAVSLVTVLLGISGVISAISFVVPILIVSVIGITVGTLILTPPNLESIRIWAQPAAAAVPSWPLSALTYTSYNLILSVAVLAPLGAVARNEADLRKAALYGAVGLVVGALSINLALLGNLSAAGFEIPMAFVAGLFTPPVQVGYVIVLLAEIYTTAVGSLYGFGARIADPATLRFKWVVVGTAGIAFVASQFGFSTLVRYLYSVVGVAGFLMLVSLAWGYFRVHLLPQPTP